ncbi:hypothetical protein ACHAXA_002592 [Cyclostephanos tholiformis]|uniref:DUF4110 domain-containing protein n=1 Tax=Cyclostephanos tholiformis TaxID=382380 RepID=A0ABD3SBE8_9STRA
MGGKRDKKKRAKDPLKRAALAAKRDAKADKAALRRLQKGGGASGENASDDDDDEKCHRRRDTEGRGDDDDWDAILESRRRRTRELVTPELSSIDEPFPRPPRGNFTWTLCPSNGMFYMFGGEYYNGAENVVFDELLRWDPDAKVQSTNDVHDDDDDDDEDGTVNRNNNVGQWTRILTPPPHPPPRCAHSAVYHNDAIYVFGGECATSERYHHYRDLWKFDIRNNTWEECRTIGGPPQARSGHRCLVWRHYMILFGGFHESSKNGDTRFFNDLHVYDFQSMTWTELKYGKLARLPPPRSACNLALMSTGTSSEGDALFVYGGYSKVKNASNIHVGNGSGNINGRKQQHHGLSKSSEGIVHVDCWALPLKSLVGGIAAGGGASLPPSPTWERITRKGEYPSGRAGTSSVVFQKNKMVVFGGVMDDEGDHHTMISTFYDDLFAFDMERRRWFAMGLREKKVIGGGGRRRRKKDAAVDASVGRAMTGAKINDENDGNSDDLEDDECAMTVKNEEVKSSGWGLDQLRRDMFAFTDGDGNVVFENVGGVTVDEKEEGMRSATQPIVQSVENSDVSRNFDDVALEKSDRISTLKEMLPSSSVMKVDHKGRPVALARVTPLPRINCASVVRNNTLYIYGGLLEVGEREVTLDDCWSIDLNKRDKWTCIWPGQMHLQVWKGVDSDNDSYISSDQGGDGGDNSDVNAAEFEPILEDEDDEESEEAEKRIKKEAKKVKEKEKRRAIRKEIAELRELVGLDNELRNPLPEESVADFYARTASHWNEEAAKSVEKLAADDRVESISTKELKREGFHLAKERHEELKKILDRLCELENLQHECEEKKERKKAEKKLKKDRSS